MTEPTTPLPGHPDPAAHHPSVPAQPGPVPQAPHGGYGAPPAHGPPFGYGAPAGYGPPVHRPQPVAPNGAPLADFGQRLVAYLIDVAIVSAVVFAIWVPAVVVWLAVMAPRAESDAAAVGVGLVAVWGFGFPVMLGAYYIYLVEMMFRTGQTVGKRVMKIKIVPTDTAATLTRAAAAKRYLVQVVGGMFGSCVFFSYLDGLWQLWDKPYRQCLHDKFAHTVVVRVAP